MVTLLVTRHFLDSSGRRDMDHTLDYHRIAHLLRVELHAAAERSMRHERALAQLMRFVERSSKNRTGRTGSMSRAGP